MTDEDQGGRTAPRRPPRDCPICGRPSVDAAYPFCSKRCADVDLNRWLVGAYAIPATEPGEEDDEQNLREDG